MSILQGKGEIYSVTCQTSGKVYIGQVRCYKCNRYWGTEGRWKSHVNNALHGKIKRCRALCNAIQKYGMENFVVRTLLICDEHQLNYFEAKYIRQYNTIAPHGYNLKEGGRAGRWSKESKARLSERFTGENNNRYGVKLSDDVKAKISRGNTGKVRSEEYKYHMSELKKNMKPENVGLPRYIYHHKCKHGEGYKIFNHPHIPRKTFTSKYLSMEEKLAQATQYLVEYKNREKSID